MIMKFKVTGYQVVHADNQRDTVVFLDPIITSDIQGVRKMIKEQHEGCKYINLNYTLLNSIDY